MARLVDDEGESLTGGFLQKSRGTIQSRVQPEKMSEAEAPVVARGAGKGRKTKLAAFGLNPTIIKNGDPRYSAALHQANRYRKTRMRELAQLHGHVSAGAGALLASAALALAASRYLYEMYASDPDGVGIELLKQAGVAADKARAAELAAWEMSAREGVIARKAKAADGGLPWLIQDEPARQKAGRKTNEQRQELSRLTTGGDDDGSAGQE